MKKEKIINTLLDLLENELQYEKDYNNCENKEYTKDLLDAKIWLMKKKKLLPIIIERIVEEDKENYLKGEE